MPRRPKPASASRARRPKPASAQASARHGARRGLLRPFVAGAVIVAVTASIVPLIWRHKDTTRQPTTPETDSPVALTYPALVALAEHVKSLQAEKRFGASLPGARLLLRQHALHGRLVPDMRVDYARMLNNAAFEAGGGG